MIGHEIAAAHRLPEGAEERFDRFHAMLYEWNARMDLTAVSERDALSRNYLDSLTALPLLQQGARVVDVGTGAGFPGIPLCIARPDLEMTLLDAREKRVAFLSAAISALSLAKAEALHARAEDFARERREAYDVAVSRAVASLPVLLEWLLPLLRVGGRCILWKGPELTRELRDAARVSPLLGGGPPEMIDAPINELRFCLVSVEKRAATDKRFPRKAGMALKRPL